jgi:hypothetical protein
VEKRIALGHVLLEARIGLDVEIDIRCITELFLENEIDVEIDGFKDLVMIGNIMVIEKNDSTTAISSDDDDIKKEYDYNDDHNNQNLHRLFF